MKTILAATDFSEGGNHAVFYAAALAQEAEARLLLVHAYKAQGSATTLFKGINEVLEQDARLALDALNEEISGLHPALQLSTQAVYGEPGEVVDQLLNQQEVDLVVTGTKGKSLLDTLFFGSTSKHLFTECRKPLLLVPANATFVQGGKLSYATALRENPTEQRLAAFADYARWWKSTWQLVHAYGDEGKLSASQQTHCNAWQSALQLSPQTMFMLRHEDILEALLEHLGKEQPLVLAIHRHHYSIIERIFVPSVGEALARKVKVPLLVLPQQKGERY